MADANYTCGWCATLVPGSPYQMKLEGTVEPGYGGSSTVWVAVACTACQRPTLFGKFTQVPQAGRPLVDTAGVPDAVDADYVEAVSSLIFENYKAA